MGAEGQPSAPARGAGHALRSWAALGAAALAGCTLLVNQSATQCATDADCARFAGTLCIAGGCVVPPPLDLTLGPSTPCTSTQDCLSLHGSNWVCRSAQCAALGSEDCGIVIGNYTADDVLLLGAVLPIYGAHKSTGVPIERALAFAADQDFSGGVPFGPDGGRHPVAVVLCDESRNAVDAAKHLAEKVKVPVIFGPAASDAFLAVAAQVAIPDHVLLISPYATEAWSLVPEAGSTGLLWRTSPTSDGEAAAMTQTVASTLEPRVDGERSRTRIGVALVWRQDGDGTSLHDRIASSLVFNGLPATAPANNPFYTDVTYGNPDAPGQDQSSAAVATITSTSPLPDVVLVVGTAEAATSVIKAIEDAWPPSSPRPYYLLSHGLEVEELLGVVGGLQGLAARVLVAAPGEPETKALRDLYGRYRAVYTDYPAETFGVPQAFDGYYLAAYALAADRSTDIGGIDLRDGLEKVLYRPGTPQAVTVGPGDIDAGFAAVAASRPLALSGTSGPLVFDGGTATADVQIWCIAPTVAGGPPAFTASGLSWSASTGALGGALIGACLQP